VFVYGIGSGKQRFSNGFPAEFLDRERNRLALEVTDVAIAPLKPPWGLFVSDLHKGRIPAISWLYSGIPTDFLAISWPVLFGKFRTDFLIFFLPEIGVALPHILTCSACCRVKISATFSY